MPLSVVQDRRARGKFKEWRAGMATNPLCVPKTLFELMP
jgi:hypothetical protein